MEKKEKIAAILLMGGQGSRFNDFIPKQFHYLSGKKIYLHTLDVFIKTSFFDQIILVCPKEALNEIKKEISFSSVKVIEGGETRQQSSYKGLLSCDEDTSIVVIHDAVRPFVSSRILKENIKLAKKHQAVDTCIETFDTIVQSEDGLKIQNIPKRKTLLRGQTPQSFAYPLILKAHQKALANQIYNSSDDCFLVLQENHEVFIVKGDDHNLKITNKLDLFIAEQLFRIKTAEISSSTTSLKDKFFVVVGGNGGIGKEICSLLEKEKAKYISLSRSSEIKLDLTDKKSIKQTFAQIYNKYGEIDGLINSAGYLKVNPLKKLSLKEIQNLIDVNLIGLILCSKEAKIKKQGHIINIGSSSCFKGRENISIYSSCKAAVVNFTQALAAEFPQMRINTLIPQRTNTPMRRKNFPKENQKLLLSPKKVAKNVIALLKNKQLTGSIIDIKK